MKFPEKTTLPTELIQRITVYNSIMAGVLRGLGDQDKAFLDKRVKTLMDASALTTFGHMLPDTTTIASLHNDLNVVTAMLIEHMKDYIDDPQGIIQ